MQKIIALLEKYVEFVALGIGAIFFLLVAWLYFQPTPQPVHFGTETQVTIANVDEKIEKGPAEDLQHRTREATVPAFPVEEFSARINRDLSMADATDNTLVASVMDQQPWKPDIKITPVAADQVVEKLPTLPAAIPFAVLSGISTVDAPASGVIGSASAVPSVGATPAQTPAPVNPAQPPSMPGIGRPVPMPGIGQPVPMPSGPPMPMPGIGTMPPSVPGAVPAAPAAGLQRTDVVWNTVMFVIPAAPLIAQWNACFGPNPNIANAGWRLSHDNCLTAVLDVKLIREVKNGDNWQVDPTTGNPSGMVGRLYNDLLPPMPSGSDHAAVQAYFEYAKTQTALITAPPFPTQSAAPAGTRIPDPTNFLPQLLTASSKLPVTPGLGLPPFEPAAPVEPVVLSSPNVQVTAQPAVLGDSFNPAAGNAIQMKDILVWLHDTTTMPGRIYRYKLSYKLQNPLYFVPAAMSKNPDWAAQVTLDSPLSPPSVEVTSHARVRYFCAQNMLLNDTTFKFDIFAWSNGSLHKRQFTVDRGDIIGGRFDEGVTDGTVDYGTGVTLVYVHNSNNRMRVVTADPDGRINVRDAQFDRDDKERRWLDAQIIAMKPATPATPPPSVVPGPPSMPGMPPNFRPPVPGSHG